MNEKDKQLSRILKESFPAQQGKDLELCEKIISQLPKRNNRPLIFAVAYSIISCSMLIFLIFNIKTISNTIMTMITSIQEQYIPDKNNLIAIVACIAIVSFIIWQIYSMLDEYYLFKNENIIRDAIGEKR